MIGLPIGFTSPLLLLALAALPVLWYLLRLVPPKPRLIRFPPTRLLLQIEPKEETPARTPWWLTLLRLLLAALVILAAAGPLLNPPAATSRTSGPIVLLVDSGWASASQWQNRVYTANAIIARAEAENRPVALIATTKPQKDVSLLRPLEAREQLRLLVPAPHAPNRADVLPGLTELLKRQPDASVLWLSDGIHLGDGEAFITALNERVPNAQLTVITGGTQSALALASAENNAGALIVKVLRADVNTPGNGSIRARDLRGLPLGDAPASTHSKPKRSSIYRSKSGTTSRVLKLPASARRARSSCSTSAGGDAPSASFPAARSIPRSPCSRRLSISPARSRLSPMYAMPATSPRAKP
jgi:hypothetical protein